MKKIFNFLIGILLFTQVSAQVGVGPAPYCMPLYSQIPCNQPWPSNTPGNSINDFIHSYNTNGATFNIVNNGSGCNAQNLAGIKNYRLWGCQYYMICSPGQVITSNFQSGNVYAQGATVFVDWNNDGVYNPAVFTGAVPGGERVTSAPGVPGAAVITPMPAWTVPTVPAGTYRMRVRCAYFTVGNTIQPCTNYGYGETEEYYVYVNTTPSTMTVNLTSNSPVCIGNMVNITTSITLGPNAGTCTPATYTYNWTGPNSFTSNVMSPSFMATTTAQSGVYTLNITPPNGCGCGSTNTIQIWVNPNPSTSITNNGPLCQGSTLTFTNNITGSGTLTYNWTGPNSYTNNIPAPIIAAAQPSNSGVYNFTVTSTFTNGGVCKATSSSSFAVVPVAQISVTPSYTQCQGTTINLNSNVVGTPTISWNGPNSYTSNLQNPVLSNVTPSVSGNYSVVATFTAPNTTLTCSSTAVSNVSVVPMNPVSISAPINICQGGNATFTANAAGSPVYSWTGPNSFTSTNASNTLNNIQPASTGVYSVNAIFSIGTVSCVTSNVTNISVVATPSITVIPNISICNGQGTVFTASAPGAISYTWTGPNNFNVASPNTTFTNLNPTWSGIYTVTAAFTNGNLTCYNANTTQLTVKPDIQFNLGPNKTLCYNDVLSVNGPNGASTYTWTGPNNFTSNMQNLYIQNAITSNAGVYTLIVDLNGCQTQNSVNVSINNPITWLLAPASQTICKGDSFTLTAAATDGSGNYAYTWNPFTYLTGPTGSVQTGVGVGTTVYNVSVYDIACPNYTINHAFTLNVNKAPVPNLTTINNQCEPFCYVYDSKVKNQSQSITYDFNGKTYFGDSINVCLNAGQYNLKITTIGLNGCKETFTHPNTIIVHEKPSADFSWNPSTPNTVSESHVTFIPNESSNVTSWTWEINGTPNGDKNPTYTFENQGNFPVSLMVSTIHGCKDTLTKIISIKDEFLLFVPDVFTPNGDGINDTFKPKGLGIKNFEMFIFDRWGEMIYRTNDMDKGWDGTFKGVMCQDDAYVYKIEVIDVNYRKHTKTGHVTLLK